MEGKFFDAMRRLRVTQKEVLHKKEARNLLKKYPGGENKLPPGYKKEIDRYWGQYGVKVSGLWHQFYLETTGIEDVRFIDNGLYYSKLIGRLNCHRLSQAYEDKNHYEILFGDRVKLPNVILRNMNRKFYDAEYRYLTFEHARTILENAEKCIVKPSLDSGGGRNIVVLNNTHDKAYSHKIGEVLQQKDYVIQTFISQNDVLAYYNSSTVNTIRIFSFLWKGQVHIIASYFRVGDESQDYVECRTHLLEIKNDGTIGRGLDLQRRFSDNHRFTELIRTTVIPGYQQIVEIVKREHRMLNYFALIGWDFTVDKCGEPVLIEINTRWPAMDSLQIFVGPAFGDLTDEIMKYAFSDKRGVLSDVYIGI